MLIWLGFYTLSGTGTIQLCALGKLLEKLGITIWDFGMQYDYKVAILKHFLTNPDGTRWKAGQS